MMLEGFLPFEATVLHIAEDIVFTHPPGGDLKVLGAASLVKVPVDDFKNAYEGDENEGLDAHDSELIPPVNNLLQGSHICDRYQKVGADYVRESHSEHGPVVPLLQVFIDRRELGPPIKVASKTPQQLVVVVQRESPEGDDEFPVVNGPVLEGLIQGALMVSSGIGGLPSELRGLLMGGQVLD